MRRLITILMALVIAMGVAEAKNWCESLVNSLNMTNGVDKSVAVNRDPQTHEITNATYDFRFSSGKLFDRIQNTMKNHAGDADYYSESGSKNKVIIMRITDNGRRWSCKLQKLGKSGKQFLVTVNSDSENMGSSVLSTEQLKTLRRQAQDAQRQAKEARRQAQEARREAQRQARQARIQANEARRQTIRSSQNNRVVKTIKNNVTSDKKTAISVHNQELQKAELERKKRLGL